jgi:hypothetical protein
LIVDDEASFSHVGLFADLKQAVLTADHRFIVLHGNVRRASWDRALFLNLTYWHAAEPVDVLVDEHIAADVVAHVAWHLLAARHLGGGGRMSAAAMLLSESIASAFDLYLVGRLLGHRPDAEMLETQVPAMAERAADAGMAEDEFEELLRSVAEAPERAFEDLRALLFDAATALYGCAGVTDAALALEALEDRRFAALLHHYELSNWVLYARAHAGAGTGDTRAQDLDTALRRAPVALDYLEEHWVRPASVHPGPGGPSRRASPR